MKEGLFVQPDRAKPRAPKLASGMFGVTRPAANDPAPAIPAKEPRDRTAFDLQHLFGRDGE